MAFTSAITKRDNSGNVRAHSGTYTSAGGSTGGNIDTGLVMCEHIQLQAKGSSVGANQNVVNETLPIAGSAITIVTTADEVGYWRAWGY